MKLNEFLASMEEGEKVMVFVNKKSRCDDIASDLCIKGTSCQSIHGDREQSDREQAIDDLRTGEVSILIATDVASRGIDIQARSIKFMSITQNISFAAFSRRIISSCRYFAFI